MGIQGTYHDHTPRTRGNHPGIIDYKGKSYVFGLCYDIFRLETPRHAERRSAVAAEMKYNEDGTIPRECTICTWYSREATSSSVTCSLWTGGNLRSDKNQIFSFRLDRKDWGGTFIQCTLPPGSEIIKGIAEPLAF